MRIPTLPVCSTRSTAFITPGAAQSGSRNFPRWTGAEPRPGVNMTIIVFSPSSCGRWKITSALSVTRFFLSAARLPSIRGMATAIAAMIFWRTAIPSLPMVNSMPLGMRTARCGPRRRITSTMPRRVFVWLRRGISMARSPIPSAVATLRRNGLLRTRRLVNSTSSPLTTVGDYVTAPGWISRRPEPLARQWSGLSTARTAKAITLLIIQTAASA